MSRYDQLAGHAKGKPAQVFVYDVLLEVVERLSDRHALIQPVDGIKICKYGTLGRAVGVEEAVARRRFNGNQPFAADRKIIRIFGVGEQRSELPADLSRHKAVGDFVFLEVIFDREQVEADRLVDDVELSAACKRGIHIHHIRVKAVTRVGGDAACFVELVEIPEPLAETAQIAVLEHYSLGHACGTRGVEHNEQVLGIRIFKRLGGCGQLKNFIGVEHGAAVVRQPVRQAPVGDKIFCVRVLYHKFKALNRIAGIERLIARSRFENAERGDRNKLRPGDQHRNHVFPAYSLAFQERGDIVGDLVELFVGKCFIKTNRGDAVGSFLGLPAEKRHHIGYLVVLLAAVVFVKALKLALGEHIYVGHLFGGEHFEKYLVHTLEHSGDYLIVVHILLVLGVSSETSVLAPDRQLETALRILHREQLNGGFRAAEGDFVDGVALIRKKHRRVKFEIGAEVRKGIEIVFAVESYPAVEFFEEPVSILAIGNLGINGIGLDEHSHRVVQTAVSAVMNSRVENLSTVGVLRQKEGKRGVEHAAQLYAVLFRKRFERVGIHRLKLIHQLLHRVLAGVFVGKEGGIRIHAVKNALIVSLSRGVFLARKPLLLLEREVARAEALSYRLLPAVDAVDFRHEHERRGHIKNNVVHIEQKIILRRRFYQIKTEQTVAV